MSSIAPLLLVPDLRERIWGGTRLAPLLDVEAPESGTPYGEAWIAHADSRIAGGPWEGARLSSVLDEMGEMILGPHAAGGMPLLIKILDAAQPLSLQVHPDDAYAATRHPELGFPGKTESWRILEAENGATVAWGFEHPVDEAALRDAIANGSIETALRSVPVAPGDLVHNPAGTVHAVGAGIVLYEVQQPSDLTYRLHDYGRVDAEGNPRELHVQDALAVSDLSGRAPSDPPHRMPRDGWSNRVHCDAYALDEVTVPEVNAGDTEGASMHVLTPLDGALTVRTVAGDATVRRACALVVPATAGRYQLDGAGTVLRARPVKAG